MVLWFLRSVTLAFLLTLQNTVIAATVDFTTSYWDVGQNANSSFTKAGPLPGLDITLTATNGKLTWNNNDNASDGCAGANTYLNDNTDLGGSYLACEGGDGIGVSNDEITGTANQSLKVEFSQAVNLHSVTLLDLFIEPPGEDAKIEIFTTADALNPLHTVFLQGIQSGGYGGAGGVFHWDDGALPVLSVTHIIFQAYDEGSPETSDYALAALEISAVPLPAAAWLFGTALLGLYGAGRSRRRAQL